jgi:regulator of protease activity HflC (stomatin/prohibitin superfamily)
MTADHSYSLEIDITVVYIIENAYDASYKTDNLYEMIRTLVMTSLELIVQSNTPESIRKSTSGLVETVTKQCGEGLRRYGVSLIAIRIESIHPSSHIRNSMEIVNIEKQNALAKLESAAKIKQFEITKLETEHTLQLNTANHKAELQKLEAETKAFVEKQQLISDIARREAMLKLEEDRMKKLGDHYGDYLQYEIWKSIGERASTVIVPSDGLKLASVPVITDYIRKS